MKKHNFDQTPKLLETLDQLIRSSEIRSSDHFPFYLKRYQDETKNKEGRKKNRFFSVAK